MLVENFRPGRWTGSGLGYEHARSLNPRLIFCSVSGFGQDGPRASQPAYDQIVQGMSGAMSLTGRSTGRHQNSGSPSATSALGCGRLRDRNGALPSGAQRARPVDRHLDDWRPGWPADLPGRPLFRHRAAAGLAGNQHPTIAPYETFRTADGWLNVACGNEGHWRRFCQALGLADLSRTRASPVTPSGCKIART